MSRPSDFFSAATAAGADAPSDDDVDMCLDHDAVADEDGFVHVTRPLMTVRQFTDWVRAVQLPDADAVMQGRLSDDTIQALVSRRTFLRDLLASFDKKKPTGHVEASSASAAAEVLVEEAAWPRLWSQFIRDLPREGLSVDGTVLSPAPDAASAQALAVDPGAYAAEVVLPCIRRFIAERLPPDARGAVESNAAPATPAPAPGGARGGIVGGLAWVLGLGGQQPAAEPTPPSYRASTSVSRLPVPPSVPPEGDDSSSPSAVLVEGYARLVVLMAQQAVLALPLEILSAQFCLDPDARLFVGEVARSDPRQRTAGMRVTLDPTPGARHGAVLRVAKTFRVFSLAGGDDDAVGGRRGAHAGPPDYTLFYVSVAIELDLLAAAASTPARPADEDHVSLSWRVEAATATAASSAAAVGQSAASASSTTTTPTAASPPAEGAPRRVCECLGASAGYHQPTCHVNWQAVA